MSEETVSRPPVVELHLHQQDWMPGFAAWASDGNLASTGHGIILLNVGAFLATVELGAVTAAELPYFIAESIAHEMIHALEEWAGVAFSEERVEQLLDRYREAAEAGT